MSPTTALESTGDVERMAVDAIRDAVEKNGFAVEREEHEPNGDGEFPDFRLVISGQEWAVEVTRVLGDIVGKRIVTVGVEGHGRSTSAARQRHRRYRSVSYTRLFRKR